MAFRVAVIQKDFIPIGRMCSHFCGGIRLHMVALRWRYDDAVSTKARSRIVRLLYTKDDKVLSAAVRAFKKMFTSPIVTEQTTMTPEISF